MTETQTKWFNAETVAAFLRGLARGLEMTAAEIEESGVPVGTPAQGTPPGGPAGENTGAAGTAQPAASVAETGESEAGAEPSAGPAGAAPASKPGNLELDAAGVPWDPRIHSGAKSKTKDGCWRNKKGVDPAVLESVTAELKAAAGAPAPEPPAGQPDLGGIPEPPGADVPEPPGADATNPPQPAGLAPKTFPEFMAELTPHLTSGAITQAQIDHVASLHGLAGALELTQREDVIPAVLAECLALCQTTQN